jgi:hypothetical protein
LARFYAEGMKHVTLAEKSLLMGDDIADCLLEYSRLLGQDSQVDAVTVRAIGPDGNTVDVSILLNSGTTLVIESTNSTVEAPENHEAVRYVQSRIDRIINPPEAHAETSSDTFDFDIDDRGRGLTA